ncbi:HK97 family phage prohead protease [Rhodovulum marinum]|uniref:Prohead serine protease domain-containing protein n=1 Tax=Rhodovulum marinum TaxID=320662 RepID=A0A4R2PUS2_9RHOB|nr:HK97 family phage prohead protease [Rhodovulum marinum]TCP39802.1 hypothetical protein EV662_110109 [Rhodovulum marinum]
MLWGGHSGGLELRRESGGSVALRGRFPYGKAAVLSDGGRTGRPRKERIGPRAFRYRVEREDEDIHLLVGHSYDRPLASRGAGTLRLHDSDESLAFEAFLSADMQEVSYVRDFLAGFSAGLIMGLSPGFRIPPERVAPNAETVEEEDPAEGMAIIRTVNEALLYELSVVTRPAYPEAQVEARAWSPGLEGPDAGLVRAINRWRP